MYILREKYVYAQLSHGVMITSLLRQNDTVTSFWRYNDVGIKSWVRWA